MLNFFESIGLVCDAHFNPADFICKYTTCFPMEEALDDLISDLQNTTIMQQLSYKIIKVQCISCMFCDGSLSLMHMYGCTLLKARSDIMLMWL